MTVTSKVARSPRGTLRTCYNGLKNRVFLKIPVIPVPGTHHLKDARLLQPVPWKMRLGLIVEMPIEILNGGEILVNKSKSESENSNSSVSRGTNSN